MSNCNLSIKRPIESIGCLMKKIQSLINNIHINDEIKKKLTALKKNMKEMDGEELVLLSEALLCLSGAAFTGGITCLPLFAHLCLTSSGACISGGRKTRYRKFRKRRKNKTKRNKYKNKTKRYKRRKGKKSRKRGRK